MLGLFLCCGLYYICLGTMQPSGPAASKFKSFDHFVFVVSTIVGLMNNAAGRDDSNGI